MIAIKLTRAALIDGKHAAAGSRLTVAPLIAADLIHAMRCELVHADDLVLVQQAVAADVRAALKRLGPAASDIAPSPWRPLH